ncbi:putative CRISPR-associated protein [Marinobacterium aestuarii]|uniref:Putative CRISPR-associated protein n=1 Tax=Marinobacterium aestuarii TaxID=1821621 RepID=A0A1A9F4I0_9GAMM|nr:putative CRISPR-associated protein [Marinobacterium aestuarii]
MRSEKTTWIVSRHPGAIEYLARQGFRGKQQGHLDPALLQAGDRVIGNLPMSMIARLAPLGVEYWHLCIQATPAERGIELSADRLHEMGASVRRFLVTEQP